MFSPAFLINLLKSIAHSAAWYKQKTGAEVFSVPAKKCTK
jgi:hypothetical protein